MNNILMFLFQLYTRRLSWTPAWIIKRQNTFDTVLSFKGCCISQWTEGWR